MIEKILDWGRGAGAPGASQDPPMITTNFVLAFSLMLVAYSLTLFAYLISYAIACAQFSWCI